MEFIKTPLWNAQLLTTEDVRMSESSMLLIIFTIIVVGIDWLWKELRPKKRR